MSRCDVLFAKVKAIHAHGSQDVKQFVTKAGNRLLVNTDKPQLAVRSFLPLITPALIYVSPKLFAKTNTQLCDPAATVSRVDELLTYARRLLSCFDLSR